jgi:hypothetical protein
MRLILKPFQRAAKACLLGAAFTWLLMGLRLHGQTAQVESAQLPDAPSVSKVGSQSLPPSKYTTRQFPTFEQREKSYFSDMFGVGGLFAALTPSVIDQTHALKVAYPPDGFPGPGKHPAHGAIPEWEEGFDGYAKRYASRYGQYLIGTTVRYGIGEALHQDVTYHRCDCTGFLPRTSHAIASSLIAHTSSGRAIPSIPALFAPFVASDIAVHAWYPSRFNTSDALRTSTGGYIGLPFKNLFIEFGRR